MTDRGAVLLETLSRADDAEDVQHALEALGYGGLARWAGVLHVAAVWESQEGPRVLRINEHTPKSVVDFFVLNAARAWADAIVTTGKIFRLEPDLRFELAGPQARALERWRDASRGGGRPTVVVLSSGRGLDFDLPVWRSDVRFVWLTGPEPPTELVDAADRRGIHVTSLERPSIRSAVSWLWAEGLERISIEAGPSTALQLYDEPCVVERLLLSTFRGASLPSEVVGDPFLDPSALERWMRPQGDPRFVQELSALWSFQGWVRRP